MSDSSMHLLTQLSGMSGRVPQILRHLYWEPKTLDVLLDSILEHDPYVPVGDPVMDLGQEVHEVLVSRSMIYDLGQLFMKNFLELEPHSGYLKVASYLREEVGLYLQLKFDRSAFTSLEGFERWNRGGS